MFTTTLFYKHNKYKVTYDPIRVFDNTMIETVDGTAVCELEEDLVMELERLLCDKLNEVFPEESFYKDITD